MRTPRRLRPFILLLLAALPACEGWRTVAGHMRDGAGNPVPGATIRFRNDIGEVAAATSDGDGRFELKTIYPMLPSRGSFRVDARGYRTRLLRLPFRDGVEVVLTPEEKARGLDWSPPETVMFGALSYGIPLGPSWSFGLSRGRYANLSRYAGYEAAFESGKGGAEVRAGYGYYGPRLGGQLSLAAIRTAAAALQVAERQSYAGAEAKLVLAPFHLRFGAFTRLTGSAPGEGHLFTAGVGLGR